MAADACTGATAESALDALARRRRTRDARKASTAASDLPTDTDMANARRLVQRHGQKLRYTTERGWLVYDGRRFAPDPKGVRVMALAKDTALSIFDELRDAGDRDAAYAHAKRSQSRRALENMESVARSEEGVLAALTDFDADPLLLNVANGTLNLATGELQPHRPDDLLSKVAEIEFDPEATADTWDAFLWRITGQDLELYQYLQRLVGYMLTGSTREQVLHFLWGNGANGKSVFCEVLLALLGEYGSVAAPDLVMTRRHGGIPNDVARLRGVRGVLMNETTQGSKFDEARLKDMTGGDTLTGRFLHAEFFDFVPTHKLLIRGNHKPAITGTDNGIWRRLRLVPFVVTIPEEEQDKDLLTKLKAELPGILTWALRGCQEWQRNGLRPPPCVLAAVDAYREEADTLGRFIGEHCTVRKLGQVKASEFQKRYIEFCRDAEERPLPAKDLPAELQRRGFTYRRTKAMRIYEGLELTVAEDRRFTDREAESDGFDQIRPAGDRW